ncbi:MAG: hypothetical protein OK442_03775 [Thaumarchaeota archaeon]|nr:hypothetical protein [Nitrososphaerota archaeon]
MTSMAPKLRAQRSQPRTGTVAREDSHASLERAIKGALTGYLSGRRLSKVKIRQIEGRSVDGFLKIEGGSAERALVDFTATTTRYGALASLEVGGKKIPLVMNPNEKQAQ